MADDEYYGAELQGEDGFDVSENYGVEGDGHDLDQVAPSDTLDELEAMRAKLKEMEEEAARLREYQARGAGAGPSETGPSGPLEPGSREEADSRSIFIGNVDFGTTPEELQQHFQNCGTVNRVTILSDKYGNPKGFAYIEFLEVDAVQNAIMLDNSELRGRQIRVTAKRTNVPGLKRGRGRRGGYFVPYYGRGYFPPPFRGRGYFAGGFTPRGRGRGRHFSPY